MSETPQGDMLNWASSRLTAFVRGDETDPFAVLGPHDMGGKTVVTAFDPGAQEMALVVNASETEMHAIPGAPGAFAGILPTGATYRLRGRGHGGQWDYDDAYRFGPVLGEMDEYLFAEGRVERLWRVLGAHVMDHEGAPGTHFAVWAPNARRVSVVGAFNAWDDRRHIMRRRGATGVWEIFVPGVGDGEVYKYKVTTRDGTVLDNMRFRINGGIDFAVIVGG